MGWSSHALLMVEELRWRRTSNRVDEERFPRFFDPLCFEDAKISTKDRVEDPDPTKAVAEREWRGDETMKEVKGCQ
jgi:hypothetical protein